MKRRLFLHTGSAVAVAALAACGGGGGGEGANAGAGAADASLAQQGGVSTAALPAKVLGCYYTTWDTGTYKITDVPGDFNVIYLFHAKPRGTAINGSYNNVGDGSFAFEHYAEVSADQIQACRRRGQKVMLTVGGAQAGYAWDNRAKSQNFVNSFRTMYDRLGGFDGIDFNNYEATVLNPGNIAAVTAEMIWIAQQLRALYGPQFGVTSPPQPNDPLQHALMMGLMNAGVLTYAASQYYDWSGFSAPGYIKNAADQWVSRLGDARNVVIGFSANYANGPSLEDCIREWDGVKATHPEIRGMFCWSAQTNLAGGSAWSRAMKPRL